MATEDWLSKRIDAASAANPLPNPSSLKKLEEILRDRLADRLLRPTELTEIANELLATLDEEPDQT